MCSPLSVAGSQVRRLQHLSAKLRLACARCVERIDAAGFDSAGLAEAEREGMERAEERKEEGAASDSQSVVDVVSATLWREAARCSRPGSASLPGRASERPSASSPLSTRAARWLSSGEAEGGGRGDAVAPPVSEQLEQAVVSELATLQQRLGVHAERGAVAREQLQAAHKRTAAARVLTEELIRAHDAAVDSAVAFLKPLDASALSQVRNRPRPAHGHARKRQKGGSGGVAQWRSAAQLRAALRAM